MERGKKVTKRGVTISLFTMSILLTVVASIITAAYAPAPPPPGKLWVLEGATWVQVDKYDVYPGVVYSLKITDIPKPDGTLIEIKVSNEGWSESRNRTVTGGVISPFDWTCPSVEPSNTFVVQYRVLDPSNDYKPGNVEVVGGLRHKGHLHVIPEFAFGTVTAILALFSGLGIYSKFKKK